MCFKQNTSSESLHLQSRRPERLGSRWPPGGNIEGVTQWTGVSTAWPRKTLWFTTGPNIFTLLVFFSSVQSLSHVWLFAISWTAACQASLSITNSQESTQTHVHQVDDAIQPSHPLSSPSPPALKLSQYQGLFQWVSSSHEVAKVLEFQPQYQSFQWTPRTDLL